MARFAGLSDEVIAQLRAKAEAAARAANNKMRIDPQDRLILQRYGLTSDRLSRAAANAVVMHPGPMNRGVEIDEAIAGDPKRSLITLQVEMGVAVRMACLEMLLGG